MIDANTNKPMKILPNGEQGGVLNMSAEQVDTVVSLLQDRGLRCWRSPVVFSTNDGLNHGTVILSRNVKPDIAQAVLDSIP